MKQTLTIVSDKPEAIHALLETMEESIRAFDMNYFVTSSDTAIIEDTPTEEAVMGTPPDGEDAFAVAIEKQNELKENSDPDYDPTVAFHSNQTLWEKARKDNEPLSPPVPPRNREVDAPESDIDTFFDNSPLFFDNPRNHPAYVTTIDGVPYDGDPDESIIVEGNVSVKRNPMSPEAFWLREIAKELKHLNEWLNEGEDENSGNR